MEIRTRLQGDTPFFPNMLNNGSVEVCLKEDVDKVLAEQESVIAELKAKNAQVEDDSAFWKNKYNACKRELDLLKDTIAFYNGGK